MVAKKWIIYDGKLLISSSVEFHSDILPKDYDKSKIQGGGRWEILADDKVMLFYGISFDFGSSNEEIFTKAYEDTLLSEAVTDNKPFFSTKEWFSDAQKEYLATK
jgi:hypothetical protein